MDNLSNSKLHIVGVKNRSQLKDIAIEKIQNETNRDKRILKNEKNITDL